MWVMKDELQGIHEHKCNAECVIIFQMVILQQGNHVSGAQAI